MIVFEPINSLREMGSARRTRHECGARVCVSTGGAGGGEQPIGIGFASLRLSDRGASHSILRRGLSFRQSS